jgi:hypothetical protein
MDLVYSTLPYSALTNLKQSGGIKFFFGCRLRGLNPGLEVLQPVKTEGVGAFHQGSRRQIWAMAVKRVPARLRRGESTFMPGSWSWVASVR